MNAAGLSDPINPLDRDGRRKLLQSCAAPESLGSTFLGKMLADAGTFEVRQNITKGAIESFHGIYTNWFNPLRSRLLYVKLSGESAATAAVKVASPELCGHRVPLVVPKIHTVLPTAGADISGAEGGGDSGGEGGEGVGTEMFVYHYVAANHFRQKLANFLASVYVGLDPVQLIAKMNYLGNMHYKKMLEQAGVNVEYQALFAA